MSKVTFIQAVCRLEEEEGSESAGAVLGGVGEDQKERRPNQKGASAGGHPSTEQRGAGWGEGCTPSRREQDLLLVFLEFFAQVGHHSFLLSSLKRFPLLVLKGWRHHSPCPCCHASAHRLSVWPLRKSFAFLHGWGKDEKNIS